MGKHLGIDFGTTNSVCAISENGRSTILKIEHGSQKEILKSVLYVSPEHKITIGQQAIAKYLWDTENLPATPPKRIATGRVFRIIKSADSGGGFAGMEDVPEIIEIDTSGRGHLLQSLKSVLGNSSYQGTEIFNKKYSLEDLITPILKELKERAEKITGKKLSKAIIGRPVRYVGKNPNEKLAIRRIKTIAKKAGFSEIDLEYEPVGAALSLGIDIKNKTTALVFDFGGGTLDICIIKFPQQKVLAVSGRAIGGDLLNTEIFKHKILHYFGANTTFNQGQAEIPRHLMLSLENWYSIAQLKKKKILDSIENLISKADDPKPVKNLQKLILSDSSFKIYQKIDQAKIKLSTQDKAQIYFKNNDFEINETITKIEFEHIVKPYLKQTKELLNEIIKTAKITKKDIDIVITTGGSSNIPVFKKLLTTYFNPNIVQFGESFTSVASGLALRSEQIFGTNKARHNPAMS